MPSCTHNELEVTLKATRRLRVNLPWEVWRGRHVVALHVLRDHGSGFPSRRVLLELEVCVNLILDEQDQCELLSLGESERGMKKPSEMEGVILFVTT